MHKTYQCYKNQLTCLLLAQCMDHWIVSVMQIIIRVSFKGVRGSIRPPWLWLAPLEILFHMSRGKVLMLWIEK